MSYRKIAFFNQYHNGDCFVGKDYVRSIAQALPEVEFEYYHRQHPDIVRDLPVKYRPLNELPDITHQTRIAESTDKQTLYINTWVGCWQGALFPHGEHINNQRLHTIWARYFDYLKLPLGPQDQYLPSIDFSHYDITAAQQFVQSSKAPLVVFCNGDVHSGQSRAGNFASTIAKLAQEFQDHRFLLTANISGLRGSNIFYANEAMPLASNLNQIAWVAQYSRLIVGKNSGPFTWCQHQGVLNNADCSMFNFSVLPTDCPSGGSRYRARCLYSPVTDEQRTHDLIHGVLASPELRGTELLL